MLYFVPSWHQLLGDWAFQHGELSFDDAVNQMRVFQESHKKIGIIVTEYQPQIASKLNELALLPNQFISVFDYLQGISHLSGHTLDVNSFAWPAEVRFDYTPFRIQVDNQGTLYATISFDPYGRILAIDYYPDQHLRRRLLMDSRGFVSREEQYQDNRPVKFTYFDEEGNWRFCHDQQTDEVRVNPEFPIDQQPLHFDHLRSLINSVLTKNLLSRLSDQDQLIITIDDNNQMDPRIFENYSPIYSVSRWHAATAKVQEISSLPNLRVVSDSQRTANNLLKQANITSTVIPLFKSHFKLGHSQRIVEQRIGVFSDQLTAEQLDHLLEIIYQRLINPENKEELHFLSYSGAGIQAARQAILRLQDRHPNEFILPNHENERRVVEEDQLLDDSDLPILKIEEHQLTDLNRVAKIFDKLRILVDWRADPDEFLEMVAVNTGIPQLQRVVSDRVVDHQNGLICHNYQELADGLSFYLDSLKNWNQSLANDVQILNRYSDEYLLAKWRNVLEK